MFISPEQFNKILRIGVFVALLLITVGGIIFLSHHFLENYYLEIIQSRTYVHRFWMPIINTGIFLIIMLQIARTVYYSSIFLATKEYFIGGMATFISLVLFFSLFYSVI